MVSRVKYSGDEVFTSERRTEQNKRKLWLIDSNASGADRFHDSGDNLESAASNEMFNRENELLERFAGKPHAGLILRSADSGNRRHAIDTES